MFFVKKYIKFHVFVDGLCYLDWIAHQYNLKVSINPFAYEK